MSRFKKNNKKGLPEISTSSLPDIIFMLLFFFMVTTVMRETTLFVQFKLPSATEIQKLERKELVGYVYVGAPVNSIYGTESRIQLNDVFADVDDVAEFVEIEKNAIKEADRPYYTTSLKIDVETKMGIVSDIKQELRKCGAYKMSYATRKNID